MSEYELLFNISKYKDPGDTVMLNINLYFKGMKRLMDTYGYKDVMMVKDNIVKVAGKYHTWKADVCSSYPTRVFVPK